MPYKLITLKSIKLKASMGGGTSRRYSGLTYFSLQQTPTAYTNAVEYYNKLIAKI
jgi:hypothetical protein